MTLYGYARVSTDAQSLHAQVTELESAGVITIFQEKESGASKDNRKQLARLMAALKPGDTLVVTRLDRLARSTRDLLNVLDELGKRQVAFKSLRDAWADTTTPHGRLILTVLGGLAEFERELIIVRTGEGRQRAMAKGVRFGRKPTLTAYQRAEAMELIRAGSTCADIGRTFNVSASTISRLD